MERVSRALSAPRMGTYEAAMRCPQGDPRALELYQWNAEVSAAFFTPLHICEVVVRNAVAEAIEASYDDDQHWPWSEAFLRSLPGNNRRGFTKSRDGASRRRSTSKVIPNLKFVFWQEMLTSRHDQRIWNRRLLEAFPNLPDSSVSENREILHSKLGRIRKLRNRIAHHEPIINRDLLDDLRSIRDVVGYRCQTTVHWMSERETVSRLLESRPTPIVDPAPPAHETPEDQTVEPGAPPSRELADQSPIQ